MYRNHHRQGKTESAPARRDEQDCGSYSGEADSRKDSGDGAGQREGGTTKGTCRQGIYERDEPFTGSVHHAEDCIEIKSEHRCGNGWKCKLDVEHKKIIMTLECRNPQRIGEILKEIMDNLKPDDYVQDKDKTLL